MTLKDIGVVEKKTLKEKALLNSAYDLFLRKGINKTVISEITENAGVAKGTFYLYFTDKYDISNKLKLKLSKKIVKKAFEHSSNMKHSSYSNLLRETIDFIYYYFKENTDELDILGKNITMCFNDVEFIENVFGNVLYGIEYSRDFQRDLYILLESLNGVIYSSVVTRRVTEGEAKRIIDIMLKKYIQ